MLLELLLNPAPSLGAPLGRILGAGRWRPAHGKAASSGCRASAPQRQALVGSEAESRLSWGKPQPLLQDSEILFYVGETPLKKSDPSRRLGRRRFPFPHQHAVFAQELADLGARIRDRTDVASGRIPMVTGCVLRPSHVPDRIRHEPE
jgi:hypothetical protein